MTPCCSGSRLRIAPASLGSSSAAEYQLWCLADSRFSAAPLEIANWYRSRMPVFKISVPWLRYWLRVTWEPALELWRFGLPLEQGFHHVNLSTLEGVRLRFRHFRTSRREWHCWCLWGSGCSPSLLLRVRSWYRWCSLSIPRRSRCWTCWPVVGRLKYPAWTWDWWGSSSNFGKLGLWCVDLSAPVHF